MKKNFKQLFIIYHYHYHYHLAIFVWISGCEPVILKLQLPAVIIIITCKLLFNIKKGFSISKTKNKIYFTKAIIKSSKIR